jgi:hypothetical protein
MILVMVEVSQMSVELTKTESFAKIVKLALARKNWVMGNARYRASAREELRNS